MLKRFRIISTLLCVMLWMAQIQSAFAQYGFTAKWGSSPTAFNSAAHIAVDGSGNVYVADAGNNRILKFSSTGTSLSWSDNTGLNAPTGITVDATGTYVYITDAGNHRIRKYTSAGVLQATWGQYGSLHREFVYPNGIAIAANGNLYVADRGNNRIQILNSTTGAYIDSWGHGGYNNGEFTDPKGIALDSYGNVYVVDASNNRVQKFSSTGNYLIKWGTPGNGNSLFSAPYGIAIDNDNCVYVSDENNNYIQKFNANGTYRTKWGTTGTADGQLTTPRGIAVRQSNCTVFVVDAGNNRVQVFTPATPTIIGVAPLSGAAVGTKITITGTNMIDVTGVSINGVEVSLFITSSTQVTAVVPVGATTGKVQVRTSPCHTALSTNNYTVTSSPVCSNCAQQAFDFNRQIGGSSGSGNYEFGSMNGIGVDPSGYIYVADPVYNRIKKFNSLGVYQTSWTLQNNGIPAGVAVDNTGNVYVTDILNNKVLKYTGTAILQAQWGGSGTATGLFNRPSGITTDGLGNVYVVDAQNYRVQKFNGGGTFISAWGGSGTIPGKFGNYPEGIEADPYGNIYVVDKGNNRIQKFTGNGDVILVWGNGTGNNNGQFDGCFDITIDGAGYVYVTDKNNNRVQKFNANGVFQSKWGSGGTANSQFNGPLGIVADAFCDIYVVDAQNYRVQKFSPSLTIPTITSFSPSTVPTGGMVNISGTNFSNAVSVNFNGVPCVNFTIISDTKIIAQIPPGATTGTFTVSTASCKQVTSATVLNITTYTCLGCSYTLYVPSDPYSPLRIADSTAHCAPDYDGIARDDAGYFYISDKTYDNIIRYDANWQNPFVWGGLGTADGKFNNPGDLTIGSSGHVFVVDHANNRIQKFTGTGMFQLKWNGTGTSTFANIKGIAADKKGYIYVTEAGANSRVMKFTEMGVFVKEWGDYGSENGNFKDPWGIDVDYAGFVYVSDMSNNRIQKFTSDGQFLAQYSSQGTGNGYLDHPRDLSIDPIGNIYVADAGNARIQKFNNKGIYLTQWTEFHMADPDDIEAILADPSSCSVYTDIQCGVVRFDLATNAPAITSFTPSTGAAGTNVVITGTNFASITSVSFNGTPAASFTVNSSTQITAVVPVHATTGPITVSTATCSGVSGVDFVVPSCSGDYYAFRTKWGVRGYNNGQFNSVSGIEVDADGYVYVCNDQDMRIEKFTSSGIFITNIYTDGYPSDLAIDTYGNVYVVIPQKTSSSYFIRKYAANGTLLDSWGSVEGYGDGEFIGPQGIDIDTHGDVYVTDPYRGDVQKFDSDGNFIRKWTSPLGAWAIATDLQGHVFVTAGQYNGLYSDLIYKYTIDGEYISTFSSSGTINDWNYCIDVDYAGNVFVGSWSNGILKFSNSGAPIATVIMIGGLNPIEDGLVNTPVGIAIDNNCNLYVGDMSYNNVQAFVLSTTPTRKAYPAAAPQKTGSVEKVVLYPNPNNGHFTVDVKDGKSYELVIYSSTGTEVERKKVSGSSAVTDIDVPEGIYMVQIILDNEVYQQKVVITK